jgi:hypothetical protein
MSEEEKTNNGMMKVPGNLKLIVDDDVAQGMYSNFQVVGSNETEFILDFAYIQPNQPRGKVRSRQILSPKHAKALLGMLTERVRDYEGRYGAISLPVRPVLPKGGSGLPN